MYKGSSLEETTSAKQQCVSDRHPRASQFTTAPQLKPSADGITVPCSAPDHEAAAPAVLVPGLIVDLVTVVCGLSVSTCDESPRAFTMATCELDVDGDVPFEEYIATDSSVETCGTLSDAEIVEMVRPSEPSHETEVDDDDAASLTGCVFVCTYGAFLFRRRKKLDPSLFLMQLRVSAQGTVIGCLMLGVTYNLFQRFRNRGSSDGDDKGS
ncbi:hypothetical protein HPB51_000944 [Rhipicephalus microplus]|uniref:HIG1 domain-containing protein n=1 Tax=Rhipicephalus microplus TaxID=6941 RepID=A0A9J6DKI8_RHIMP|nr:hypothetical protein HPB51_000944 [Rhipicephalus microplus]